jgi:uncharacterized membrane protein YdbT with pleckstrin-like domain
VGFAIILTISLLAVFLYFVKDLFPNANPSYKSTNLLLTDELEFIKTEKVYGHSGIGLFYLLLVCFILIPFFLFGVFLAIYTVIQWKVEQLILTKGYIKLKKGILKKQTKEIAYNKITGANYQRNIWGIQSVKFTTANNFERIVFANIAEAKEVLEEVKKRTLYIRSSKKI